MHTKKSYRELLKSPHWQKMRLVILERDNFMCRHCHATEETLHVHHKYYEKGKLPWEYPTESLITLCESCHKEEEYLLYENPKLFIDAFRRSGFRADDLNEFTRGLQEINLNENFSSFRVACAYSHALKTPEIQLLLIELFEKYLDKMVNEHTKNNTGLFRKPLDKVEN